MATPAPAKRGKKPRAAAPAASAATGQVQSLTRGLKLLEYISEAQGNVALTDLAQQAGLPNSTTHRLLTTMQQQGFVRQVGDLGLWTIGSHAFVVGSSFLQSRNLLAMVHPTLRRLMEESGETVNLAVLDTSEYQAIIIDQVQCTALMRMSAPIGGKLPMHASGAGKAFLATLPDDQVTKLLHKKGMHTYTPHTLTPHNLKEGWRRSASRASPLTTKSTRSGCAAWRPASSTSTAKPSPPFPSPARCRASPTIA
ncbi:acetate operon repressor [Serratia marcescens]|nr:acetate operon repressor [Serratia marcescens]